MKKLFLSALLIGCILPLFAAHITGGEMIYEYLGPGSTSGTSKYRITLRLFRDDFTTGAAMPATVTIGIYNNDNNAKVVGTGANSDWDVNITNGSGGQPVPVNPFPPCMINPPVIAYHMGLYSFTVDLATNFNGYTCDYQTCCRVNGLANVPNNVGSTYACSIPGNVNGFQAHDNSPQFITSISAVCYERPFTLDFSATDVDGDSLSYSFCSAYDGGAAVNSGFNNPAAPPYNSVTYLSPFSGFQPLGPLAHIDQYTGIISGIAPAAGKYVVCVCAATYRNGFYISTHRKDFILTVSPCDFAGANLNPDYLSCGSFTVGFYNNTNNPLGTIYHWDFGVPWLTNDTSNLPAPFYTYPDTGVFTVKLVVTLPGGVCIDSAYEVVKVYPGFFPGFIHSLPLCRGVPIQFTDTTVTHYGTVTGWIWDFGDPSTLADTSHLQNPVYTYNTSGTYNVQLIVGNTKGCLDTVIRPITISDPPIINLFPRDTTYCGLDSLQITATGIGVFSWIPLYNIIGANTGTPIVFPAVTTLYRVTLNDNGCISNDSVWARPRNDLTNSILTSANPICEEDTITLTGQSNYTSNLSWQWSPVANLSSPLTKVTLAYPIVSTTYNLQTRWGNNCVANTSIPITVRPLAVPDAGPDTALCSGQGIVQLHASGGVTYHWTPATGLSNPNIANPFASPSVTTVYTVAVGVTGCSKTRTDSVVVAVRQRPTIAVTNDTLICSIDTLQLIGSGNGNWLWSPNYMISNINAQNPLVSPDVPTLYRVRLSDSFGCYSDDSVFVDVKLFVTIDAGNDTSLCKTDGFFLNTTSDALHYKWTPSTYLNNDTMKHPFTLPLTTIRYHVIGNIGKCQSEDSVNIKVIPYPPAYAGNDTAVCFGFNVPLHATGGSNYIWTPSTFLSNRLIPDPICIRPTANIRYIVNVTDTLGCPKPVQDTVWVRVYAKVIADAGPPDTTLVLGQPLQLHGTGGATYIWTPFTWLNNPFISSPVSLPQDNILYLLEATSPQGCKGIDSIQVRLFRVDPDMYVPTAFTPNGDGLNDVIRPILIGMRSLNYFRVYNRFGQMLYSTSDMGQGWDGNYGGRGQDPGTYVWYAEGETYKGEKRFKKGYVVLIRQ